MINKNETYSIEITDIGNMGEGIGRVEGMTVFVPGTVPGDIANVEITQLKKNFARGRLSYIETPSADRTDSVCEYADECGGCVFQAMKYEAQLRLKEKSVRDKLVRIGGFKEPQVEPIIGMENPFRYRNKAQYAIGRDGSVGFYQSKSHRVIDCDSCRIQSPAADAAAEAFRAFQISEKLSVYDEKTGKGLLRRLVIRTSFSTGEVMAVIVLNGKKLPEAEKLVNAMYDAVNAAEVPEGAPFEFYELRTAAINVNKAKSTEIFGAETNIIYGQPVITDYIGEMKFEISPTSFYQVNPTQMRILYEKAAEFASLTGTETVFDLYCGVGTIGLFLAAHAGQVRGIEIVKSAVIDANRNAVINGIVNVQFTAGKAEDEMPALIQSGISPDVVILDPPRAGCARALLDAVRAAAPSRIVYISCDPATLARDLRILSGADDTDPNPAAAIPDDEPDDNKPEIQYAAYQLARVQPVDMFAQSGHVETVVCLSRK